MTLSFQTQDSKFEPWHSEAEHSISRSRRLPTRGWVRNMFCFFQTAKTGNRTPSSGVKGSGVNHYSRAPAHVVGGDLIMNAENFIRIYLKANENLKMAALTGKMSIISSAEPRLFW